MVASVGLALGVLAWSRLRFWYPHDEGLLALAGWRVLHGEVPHHDFVHPYTGGEALLHALFLAVGGPSLATIRTGFAITVAVWLVLMAWWCRRHSPPAIAALVVLLLGSWGVPMYPAAMPSWYVTMLATAAVAIVTFDRRPPALVAAGGALGLALAFKVTGLYALVGITAWLWYCRDPSSPRIRLVLLAGIALPMLAALVLLWPTASVRTLVHLAIPPLVVGSVVIRGELIHSRSIGVDVGPSALVGPAWLMLGVAIGVLPVLLWLVSHGAMTGLLHSITSAASLRAAFAGFPPPPVGAVLLAVPLVALVASAWLARPPHPWVVVALCTVVFVLSWEGYQWHRGVWQAFRGALPLGYLLLGWRAWRSPSPSEGPWLAAVAVLGWMVLAQFPFAAPVYFVYLVPVAIVGIVGIRSPGRDGGRILAILGIALALFGYLQVIPSAAGGLGFSRTTPWTLVPLPGERGGLLVPPQDAATYRHLLGILNDSVPPGPIWSGPDSPEVAFLAGREELNRSPFGFLAGQEPTDPTGTVDAAAAAIVIRRTPPFSDSVPAGWLADREARYRNRAEIGPFTVLWRAEQ